MASSVRVAFLLSAFLIFSVAGIAQTTDFTYQGQLQSSSAPANGIFDFEFALFDSGGTQIGSPLIRNGIAVANGIFSVNLDFGAGFPGAPRLLEVRVRQTGGGAFTTLLPRQPVTSSPYSIKSLAADSAGNASTATTATNALNLGGTAASQYLLTNGNGSALTNLNASNITTGTLSNARLGTNVTITGTGTAAVFNATDHFEIGGSQVLSTAGGDNLFVGDNAGAANATTNNTFVGSFAGAANTTGTANAYFGRGAGQESPTGSDNSFFGVNTGRGNSTGSRNSFFGRLAGRFNAANSDNTFIGYNAGGGSNVGTSNTYVGSEAGAGNTGSQNAFFGQNAGKAVGAGIHNSQFERQQQLVLRAAIG
jgi:hypothetical protein